MSEKVSKEVPDSAAGHLFEDFGDNELHKRELNDVKNTEIEDMYKHVRPVWTVNSGNPVLEDNALTFPIHNKTNIGKFDTLSTGEWRLSFSVSFPGEGIFDIYPFAPASVNPSIQNCTLTSTKLPCKMRRGLETAIDKLMANLDRYSFFSNSREFWRIRIQLSGQIKLQYRQSGFNGGLTTEDENSIEVEEGMNQLCFSRNRHGEWIVHWNGTNVIQTTNSFLPDCPAVQLSVKNNKAPIHLHKITIHDLTSSKDILESPSSHNQ